MDGVDPDTVELGGDVIETVQLSLLGAPVEADPDTQAPVSGT